MYITQRPTIEKLERKLNQPVKCLDHGYIIPRDYMGSDQSIANAARISYQNGTRKLSDDANLIRYLVEHKHTSPLEQCEIQFEMKLPIFVARQLVRHRTAALNEMSARYSILEKEFYIPKAEDCAPQSKLNKQGRDGKLPEKSRKIVLNRLTEHSLESYQLYEYLLGEDAEGNQNDGIGLARELSRMTLPLNFYTKWVWKIDLHNLLHFLKLRMDSHAQYEIRVYADAIFEIIQDWVPLTIRAWENAVLRSASFTGEELEILQEGISKKADFWRPIIQKKHPSWSDRKIQEFLRKLGA